MQQLWLVTVPNNKDSGDVTFEKLKSNVQNCKLYRFEIPNLVVGTLDSLMTLSDELTKINSQVENVVRKVERQYLDITSPGSESLRINSLSVEAYLRKFDWDFARYQHSGRPLTELVQQIQALATKIDDELKKLSVNYSEKTLMLSTLQRKKTTNLLTSDFEDFLTPEFVARIDVLKAESEKILETVMVVCPKSLENELSKCYESIGRDIVKYGDGYGSPVVPGSLKKVYEDNDNAMFSIVILKRHYTPGKFDGDIFVHGTTQDFLEPLKIAFREKKFTIREFVYDGNKSNSIDGQIEVAKQQVDQTLSSITRWCQIHYGEVYSGWIHLKVIRGFVESVLRYGLPVNFLSLFLEPNMQKEKQIKTSLCQTISKIRPELVYKKSEEDEEEGEETDNLPFVCQKFNVIGAADSK